MTGPRPRALVVVLGTATDVGKTWVGAATLHELASRGRAVAARKPAQSFDPDDDHPTDASVLAAATGEHPNTVCPERFCYPVAMAPPMAADEVGRPVPSLADLLDGMAPWESDLDLGLVETVGGPRSPLAGHPANSRRGEGADSLAVVAALEPDRVVLVADAGLGTINAVRLSAEPLARPPLVMLNRWDADDRLHQLNHEWLTSDGFAVLTNPSDLADHLDRFLG